MNAKSGAQAGADNVASLAQYLEDLARTGRPFPTRGGRPNLSEVALACGFDRQVLYKNPAAKALVAEACARIVDAPTPGDEDPKPVAKVDRRDRTIQRLEQENASLRAEVASLRERIRRLETVEEIMVSTGRRAAL